MNAFNPEGSSKHVDFFTTKQSLLQTGTERCQVNYVVFDSDWEAAFAERLERIGKSGGYVKNHGLGFEVPYVFMGEERVYRPDFIVHWDDGDPILCNSSSRSRASGAQMPKRRRIHCPHSGFPR